MGFLRKRILFSLSQKSCVFVPNFLFFSSLKKGYFHLYTFSKHNLFWLKNGEKKPKADFDWIKNSSKKISLKNPRKTTQGSKNSQVFLQIFFTQNLLSGSNSKDTRYESFLGKTQLTFNLRLNKSLECVWESTGFPTIKTSTLPSKKIPGEFF